MNILIAAAVSSAFNLACSGTVTTRSLAGEKADPYTSLYRINLDTRKYCEEECKAIRDIADIQPTQLILQSKSVDTPSEKSLVMNLVDRETGAHTVTVTSGAPRDPRTIVIMKWAGRCERQPFSGFPSFPTKF